MSLTTRHTVTVEIDVDHERLLYSNLPGLVADWTARDVETAIAAGHAKIVRDAEATFA